MCTDCLSVFQPVKKIASETLSIDRQHDAREFNNDQQCLPLSEIYVYRLLVEDAVTEIY
jgi:hypothetical protein